MDISGTCCFFCSGNSIYDVISAANPYPYTAKFAFVDVRNNFKQESKRSKRIDYVHSVVVY